MSDQLHTPPVVGSESIPAAAASYVLPLLDEQRRRWRQGERVLIEAYLDREPALRNNVESLLDLVYNEVILRELDGETPRLEEYLERFPTIAAQLRLQFEVDQALQASELLPSKPSEASGMYFAASRATANQSGAWPTIPGYSILGVLGRGGMGVAYKAWDLRLKRLVALKTIRSGDSADPEEQSRLRAEAETVARLHHPQIVQIYEVGEHEGRPFCALEFVDGGSLADKLNGMPWPGDEAARLIEVLARTIHYAHVHGVIHRDLKPANILLERKSETQNPQSEKEISDSVSNVQFRFSDFHPKVTDFGLAKHLDVDTGQTKSGAILGTPSYMAPEQAAGKSKEIGPAADVYALGAILYEMLTGRPPFRAAAMLETLELVRSAEPVAPRRLQPHLPRDLETVCLKCLEKDPKGRYQSARAVAEELQRYLRKEPIRARPVNTLYRALRWCRREPALAAASGVAVTGVLCALGLALGLAIQQSRAALRLREEVARAEQAEQDAVASAAKAREDEQRAKLSAEESRAVLGFFENQVVAAARPKGQDGGLGRETTLRAAIDASEPLIPKVFAEQPTVEASIRHSIGTSYFYLGEPKLAVPQLELAVAGRRAHLGRDHPDTLRSMNNLVIAYRAAGLLEKAIPLAEETLALRKATLGVDDADTISSINCLALAYRDVGRAAEALPLLEQSFQLHKAKLGEDHIDTLRVMNNMALAYRDASRFSEALALLEEAVKLSQMKLGPDHPDTLTSMNNLAHSYLDVVRIRDATSLYEATVRLRKSRLGPDHPDTLLSMRALGVAYLKAGLTAKAISLQTETFNLSRAKLGSDHPTTLAIMNALATAHWSAGRYGEAISLYEEQLNFQKAKLGPNHPSTVSNMGNLAMAYSDAGRLSDAISLQEEVFRIQKATLGTDHIDTLASQDNLAEAYLNAGRLTESLALYEEAVRRMKAALAPGHPLTLDTQRGLARVLMARRECADAEKVLVEASASADKHQADNPLEGASIRTMLGECLISQGKYHEAEAILRAALASREPLDAKGWETAWAKSLLGASLLGQREFAGAEPLLVTGYNQMKDGELRIPVLQRSKVDEVLNQVVHLYDLWGKKDKADLWRQKQSPPSTVRKTGK
jgi:serine/threonine protein kinase